MPEVVKPEEPVATFRCTDTSGKVNYSATMCAAADTCTRWDGHRWSPDACNATRSPADPARDREISATSATPSTHRIIREHAFGCQSREIFERIVQLNADGDRDASDQAIALGIAGGDCALLEQGAEVYVDDTAFFSGLVKLRPRGRLASYWTIGANAN